MKNWNWDCDVVARAVDVDVADVEEHFSVGGDLEVVETPEKDEVLWYIWEIIVRFVVDMVMFIWRLALI